uniref:Histone H1 like1 n=1 Tax=Haplochromis burtoni TaxID=8153 RepID=A0A3Q2WM34_HAPBU
MAEVAPAAAPAPAAEAAPAKAPAKKKKAASASKTTKKAGPSASELIVKAVKESKERKGLSLAAIKKDLVARGYDVEHNSAHVRRALKSLVQKGALVHTTGTGASGSFKAAKPAENICLHIELTPLSVYVIIIIHLLSNKVAEVFHLFINFKSFLGQFK